MTLYLGIDTGGTYTDAVLFDETAPWPGIVAKAKALTTRDDLTVGIAGAIDEVLTDDAAARIGLASISTTLATNALVEGRGGRVALVLIGFDDRALERGGLAAAVDGNPVIMVAGGHDATGARQARLDIAALGEAAARGAEVEAFAVVAHFGTRDPVDEIAARAFLRSRTGLPVTCGHELSSRLNGPKRALTAVLNARLIGMISALIEATGAVLAARGLDVPLMIVRGDGSLVSAAFARERPIETILSGPAASLVGAAHLTGLQDALVSDIGGTTTDIAVLRGGRPGVSTDGAVVGGHRTMVEAVAMTTSGLGGDSAVRVDDASLAPRLLLGPRRVIPISALATAHGALVHGALDAALTRPAVSAHDTAFVIRGPARTAHHGLRRSDLRLLERIGGQPAPARQILNSQSDIASLNRLVDRGLAVSAGFTPTDAAHVLGDHVRWDRAAAEKAARLVAALRDAGGRAIAGDPVALSVMVRDTLIRRSAELALGVALADDGIGAGDGIGSAARNPLIRAALDGHRGSARIDIGLSLPLAGLGAGASLYYPAIAAMLGTEPAIPVHADVANAVGAVVGQVRLTREATITQPAEGCFRVHLPDGVRDFADVRTARSHALDALRRLALDAARLAGAADPEMTEGFTEKTATVEGRKILVEATARVTATGRPRLA